MRQRVLLQEPRVALGEISEVSQFALKTRGLTIDDAWRKKKNETQDRPTEIESSLMGTRPCFRLCGAGSSARVSHSQEEGRPLIKPYLGENLQKSMESRVSRVHLQLGHGAETEHVVPLHE